MISAGKSEIAISRIADKDVESVAGLLRELLHELSQGNGPSHDAIRATALHLIREGAVLGAIASIDAHPVGVVMLNECAAVYAGGHFGEITELFVRPEVRSKGVAAKLVAEAKAIARERAWKRLEVGAPDQPAWSRTLDFYLREGFQEVGPRLRMLV